MVGLAGDTYPTRSRSPAGESSRSFPWDEALPSIKESEERSTLFETPPLVVNVSVRFTDPAVGPTHNRSYESSQTFGPSDRVCTGLLRRIEHCCREFITRRDSDALSMWKKDTGAPKPLVFEATFRIFKSGMEGWTERVFKSYQSHPATPDLAREVVLSTHRTVGLFLKRHDKNFRWLDGTLRQDEPPPAHDTFVPSLHVPQPYLCVPRSRFVDSTQSFEFIPGYTIELSFSSRNQQQGRPVFSKTLKINSKQSSPLNLVLSEDLLWQVSESIGSALAFKKRNFDQQHRETCSGLDGPHSCEHLDDEALHIAFRVANNIGPSYTHLHRQLRSKLSLFHGDGSGEEDCRAFLQDVETRLVDARDLFDSKINEMDDFELRILNLKTSTWSVRDPARFHLDASASYSRRSIEAVLQRVQTGIADVLRGEGVAIHIDAYKRGHLVLDKVLVARRDDTAGALAIDTRSPDDHMRDVVSRLQVRIQEDIDAVCLDTCSLDDIPEEADKGKPPAWHSDSEEPVGIRRSFSSRTGDGTRRRSLGADSVLKRSSTSSSAVLLSGHRAFPLVPDRFGSPSPASSEWSTTTELSEVSAEEELRSGSRSKRANGGIYGQHHPPGEVELGGIAGPPSREGMSSYFETDETANQSAEVDSHASSAVQHSQGSAPSPAGSFIVIDENLTLIPASALDSEEAPRAPIRGADEPEALEVIEEEKLADDRSQRTEESNSMAQQGPSGISPEDTNVTDKRPEQLQPAFGLGIDEFSRSGMDITEALDDLSGSYYSEGREDPPQTPQRTQTRGSGKGSVRAGFEEDGTSIAPSTPALSMGSGSSPRNSILLATPANPALAPSLKQLPPPASISSWGEGLEQKPPPPPRFDGPVFPSGLRSDRSVDDVYRPGRVFLDLEDGPDLRVQGLRGLPESTDQALGPPLEVSLGGLRVVPEVDNTEPQPDGLFKSAVPPTAEGGEPVSSNSILPMTLRRSIVFDRLDAEANTPQEESTASPPNISPVGRGPSAAVPELEGDSIHSVPVKEHDESGLPMRSTTEAARPESSGFKEAVSQQPQLNILPPTPSLSSPSKNSGPADTISPQPSLPEDEKHKIPHRTGRQSSHVSRDSVDTIPPLEDDGEADDTSSAAKDYRPATAGYLGLRQKPSFVEVGLRGTLTGGSRLFSKSLDQLRGERGSQEKSVIDVGSTSTGLTTSSSSSSGKTSVGEQASEAVVLVPPGMASSQASDGRPKSSGCLASERRTEEEGGEPVLPRMVMIFAGMALANKVLNNTD